MCLYTNKVHPSIAQKDIVCYKVMFYKEKRFLYFFKTHKIISEFQSFVYKFNKQYKTTLNITKLPSYLSMIKQGFHSFQSLQFAKFYAESISGLRVFKCVIPKGSQFFKGINNDLVSNQIIIKEIL